jgi:transcription elongation factor GreA
VVEHAGSDVVAPGTIVEIRMGDDDTTTEYLVGSIEERHESVDVLSVSSPLGQALSGASPGDVVEYAGPRRTFQVEVIRVRPAE